MKKVTVVLQVAFAVTCAFGSIVSHSTPAHAADPAATTRLATVDVHRILNGLAESHDKRKELDKVSLNAKKDVKKKQESLKSLEEKIKAKKLTDGSAEVERYRTQVKELQRYVKDTEEDIKRRYMKINKTLTERVLKAIASYAKENRIDLVLDKSQAVRGPVLFGNPATDITESVIRAMNG